MKKPKRSRHVWGPRGNTKRAAIREHREKCGDEETR